ncbi:alpha/beta hydrolase [Thermopolyspora sp. NPDC052614]|uniref:alpha/beta hydrolase n=1 Tax=Thermopolyspora sp. NPDC052614 TaxID=3155682 RepID=UPI00344A8D7C
MRKTVATLAIAGAGLSVLLQGLPANAAPSRNSTAPKPSAIAWSPCTGALEGLECASIPVPLDYRRPWGKKIKIALSRKPHTVSADKYQGVLLLNPGGPGASGLAMPTWFAGSGAEAASGAYDLIGFDPRGAGASEPRLDCGSGYDDPVRADYVPANFAEEKAWLARAKDFARKCGQALGWLLPYMTTEDSARDLDSIRKALGQKQINFLGYSWGTYLGATYATLFPNRVRRLVLDSVVRPSGVWYADNLDQNRAFDARAKDFFAWTAKHDSVYHLGTTGDAVEKKYYEIRAALKAKPAGGKVGPSEFDDTFLVGGYANSVWPFLAAGLAEYAAGSEDFLVFLYGALAATDSDSGHALYLATSCTDNAWPRSWATWHRDAATLHRTAPFLTWGNTWFNAPCFYWPAKPERPVRISGHGLPPVLIIQSTKDAATPYQGAVEMHRLLRSSRLIVEDGGGNHGVTLAGNACLDGHLAAYLTDGTVPASRPGPDALCAPVPDPEPLAAANAAARSATPQVPEVRVRR